MASKHKSIKRGRDEDTDTDSDNEMFNNNGGKNWPRFLLVQSTNEDLSLQKLSPFAVQKGFQAIAGTLKSIKRLRDGSFLVECGRGPRPKTCSRQTALSTNQSESQFTRPWTPLGEWSGVGTSLTCRRLRSGMNWRIRVWLGLTEWRWRRGRWSPPTLSSWRSFLQNSERDHGRLSKGDGGLVCSQPDVLLQLQQIWPHEPTLQGCCEVSGLRKR